MDVAASDLPVAKRACGAALVLLLASASSGQGQTAPGALWVVGGGGGAVIRTVHQGSFGWNFQAARMLQPARYVYLEPGLTLQHYRRSAGQGGSPCPDPGCPPPIENALTVVGPEVRVAYRDPQKNPVYPFAGMGAYWTSSQDTSGVKFGTTLGLGISLRKSGFGPALDFRWLRIYGDPRFHDVFPIAIRWSF